MKTDSNSMIELRNRREFLRDMAILGGAAALAGRYLPSTAFAANASNRQWRNQIGLELFTIRSLMNTPEAYEKALADISEIGIREIEPAGGYAGMEPAPFRAMLDKYNLSMPSTHSGASEGPDLEKTLEGFQIMGMKYTEISSGGGGGRGGRGGRGGAAIPGASPEQQAAVDELTAATADANQAATDARNALIAASLAVPRNVAEIQTRSAALAAAETRLAEARAEALARIQGSPNRLNEEQLASLLQQNGGPAPAGGRGGRGGGSAPQTVESVKRAAEVNNEHGRMAQKFGMKILIHNHTGEFERLAGSDLRQHDVMVAETDPELVTMQLDIGWSSVAGGRCRRDLHRRSASRWPRSVRWARVTSTTRRSSTTPTLPA